MTAAPEVTDTTDGAFAVAGETAARRREAGLAERPWPRHVAIIMDGNARWAAARGLPRLQGHRAGVEAVRRVVRAAGSLGLEALTIYSFSSENWKRPPGEVRYLMGLLRRYVKEELGELVENNVRIRIIGKRSDLQPGIAALLDRAERATAENTGLTLVIAFNYGGQDDIVRAARALAEEVAAGRLAPGEITPEMLGGRLDTAGIPDPDLLIRTSGEQRISNFLIWQAAYSEFVFQDVLWPDYDGSHLAGAIRIFQQRERRFGGRKAAQGRTRR
ncbi:MAG: isoprenyl transferase [Alphaproteobacteria bacterium]